MNNTTRAVIATAAIGALLIPLAGCGNTTTSSGKTELTVWSWDTSINRAAKSFMKANPDITVKVSNVGQTNETYTALNNAAQAGSGLPDVTLIEYLAIPQFVHSDTLMDLSKVYDTAKLKDTFTPGTWNSVNINGGLYAMPADSGPMAYFYDKDVFDKAGISEPPATWDEFYEDAKKIRATGSYITSDSGDGGLFNAMMWAMGGHAYKLNDDKLTINITKDKGAQRFMDLWQKMRDEDLIDVHTKSWTDDWMKSLGGGSIASLISGAWMANNLLQGVPQATGKFRVALLPTIDGTPINGEYGGSGLAIAKKIPDGKLDAAKSSSNTSPPTTKASTPAYPTAASPPPPRPSTRRTSSPGPRSRTPTAATTSSSEDRNTTRSSPKPPRMSPANGSSCPSNPTPAPSTATAWDRSSRAKPPSEQLQTTGRRL